MSKGKVSCVLCLLGNGIHAGHHSVEVINIGYAVVRCPITAVEMRSRIDRWLENVRDGRVLSIFVLYDSPGDHPGRWVMREWRVHPCGTHFASSTTAFFQNRKQADAWGEGKGLVWLPRKVDDDPCIAGTYM